MHSAGTTRVFVGGETPFPSSQRIRRDDLTLSLLSSVQGKIIRVTNQLIAIETILARRSLKTAPSSHGREDDKGGAMKASDLFLRLRNYPGAQNRLQVITCGKTIKIVKN
jgi:hypothetical protein